MWHSRVAPCCERSVYWCASACIRSHWTRILIVCFAVNIQDDHTRCRIRFVFVHSMDCRCIDDNDINSDALCMYSWWCRFCFCIRTKLNWAGERETKKRKRTHQRSAPPYSLWWCWWWRCVVRWDRKMRRASNWAVKKRALHAGTLELYCSFRKKNVAVALWWQDDLATATTTSLNDDLKYGIKTGPEFEDIDLIVTCLTSTSIHEDSWILTSFCTTNNSNRNYMSYQHWIDFANFPLIWQWNRRL